MILERLSNKLRVITGLLFILLAAGSVDATHIRAGEIRIERVSCQSSSLEFKITVIGYVDLESIVEFGGGELDFGDGSDPITRLRDVATLVTEEDLGNLVGLVVFEINHVYGAPGNYRITYREFNRNANIVNIENSVNTPFFIDAQVNIDPFLGCNNSPILQIPPIDQGCIGVAYFHNPGAFDIDGDSLSYEIVIPFQNDSVFVGNYRFPNDDSFGGAQETGDVPTLFQFDELTGDIEWNSPGIVGEYNIAFIVREWRKIRGQYFPMGFVRRDMQIIIEACENDRPEVLVPMDICVEAGTLINENIIGRDPNGDPIIIEAFSGVFDFVTSPATVSPDPPAIQQTPGSMNFQWQTTCDHVRDQPYQVRFKVSDVPAEGPQLVEFGTWNITVVGPAPTGLTATVSSGSSIDVNWDDYSCNNAEIMQVWRRVDSFNFPADECLTGIPEYAGYELIDQLSNINTTTYVDDSDLAPGATYCYRLVAIFPFPGGGQSYASAEVCATIGADAPVITNVSVIRTDEEDGRMFVRWQAPFDVDQSQFPPPYTYDVYRATGFGTGGSGGNGAGGSGNSLEEVQEDPVKILTTQDTVFIDSGLDTEFETYNYAIVLIDANGVVVDTSATASNVRLEPTPLFEKIELKWTGNVPWSINSQDYPYHYIWRADFRTFDSINFVLIDSIDVNQAGLSYLDDGSFNNQKLEDSVIYCYFITTFGTYGNPGIKEPLINLSQMVCVQPSDTIPPCTPIVQINSVDCERYIAEQPCNVNVFFNDVIIEPDPSQDCDKDILEYIIYYSRTGEEGTYVEVDRTNDDIFRHFGLSSFAGCYQVAAVDRSGNISPLSEPICVDNCPNYVLPNVFTPNGDGYNDIFSAFSEVIIGQGQEGGIVDNSQCPRFVQQVEFRVFNRWGKQVFEYVSGGEDDIFINWDGKGTDGTIVSAGTYYYIADVTFDLLDQSDNKRQIKGWIHVMK